MFVFGCCVYITLTCLECVSCITEPFTGLVVHSDNYFVRNEFIFVTSENQIVKNEL